MVTNYATKLTATYPAIGQIFIPLVWHQPIYSGYNDPSEIIYVLESAD